MQDFRRISAVRALAAWVCALVCLAAPAASSARPAEPGRPELVLQLGHSGIVESVAWSPDGRLIASAGDTSLRLWDAATGRELRALEGGGRGAVFTPDGRLVASASMGGPPKIRVFEVATGRELRALALDPKASSLSIAISADGRRLASGGFDKLVRLWNLETGEQERVFEGHGSLVTDVAFDPEGRWLASASWDNTIKLWDMGTGRQLRELTGHRGGIDSLAVSPDGRWLATGGNRDGVTMLWDAESGAARATFQHGHRVMGLAFSPNGQTLATGSLDGTVKLVDVATARETGRLVANARYRPVGPQPAGGRMEPPRETLVTDVAFSPDGSRLAAASMGQTIALWDLTRRRQTATLGGRVAGVDSIVVSPDGGSFAAGREDGSIRLWDLPSGHEVRAIAAHGAAVDDLAFGPDGSTLLSRGDGVKTWDLATGRAVRSDPIKLGTGVAISPDGRLVAAGTATTDGSFSLSDAAGGPATTLSAGSVQAQDFAFSPEGARLAVATGKTGLTLVKVGQTAPPKPACDVAIFAVGSNAPPFRLVGHRESALAVAWAPDGRSLASAGSKGDVELWDAQTGRATRTLETPSRASCTDVAFDPDGRALAVARADGSVDVWNLATGQLVWTALGHTQGVASAAFTPDGRRLLSASADGSVGVWDAANGERLATVCFVDSNDWLVTTPDGLFDGTPGAWSAILWRFSNRIDDVAPVEAFFGDFYHPGLLSEVMKGSAPRPPSDIARKDRRLPRVRMSFAPAGVPRSVGVRIDVAEAAPGAGVRDVRLFRNGSLVKVWRGDVAGGATTLEATIPVVAGENRLTAYAFNRDNVKSEDATLSFGTSPALARKATLYVVAVGVNAYANPDFDLKFAVADAETFAGELAARQVALGRCADVKVVTLTDAEATRAGILAALDGLANAGPEDTVVVYFAGHGLAFGDRFYLVPHDLGFTGRRAELRGPAVRRVLEHSISDEELERAFERVDAGELLLVVDACDSGQALATEDPRFGPTNSRGLAQLAYEKGMYVLTGSQAYQSALEAASLGHGYLTYALVEEGLKTSAADSAPKDGEIMIDEWLDYAVNRVPAMQRGRLADARKIGLREDTVSVVQCPRVFSRRGAGARPFPIARP